MGAQRCESLHLGAHVWAGCAAWALTVSPLPTLGGNIEIQLALRVGLSAGPGSLDGGVWGGAGGQAVSRLYRWGLVYRGD